jgi:hypothetical protein
MYLSDWSDLISRHFVEEYEIFVPERGWGERVVKNLAIRLDPHGSIWRAARLLGGDAGRGLPQAGEPRARICPARSDTTRCCAVRIAGRTCAATNRTRLLRVLRLSCAERGRCYTLLRSEDRAELYPGDRGRLSSIFASRITKRNCSRMV